VTIFKERVINHINRNLPSNIEKISKNIKTQNRLIHGNKIYDKDYKSCKENIV